jgi:hypothetical protein
MTFPDATILRRDRHPFDGPRQRTASRLVSRDTLANIKPSFENDTNIVTIPPEQSAFSNCEKVVERDVEMYRKATLKEQQATCGMFDHVALQSVRGRAGFGTSGHHD